MDNYRQRCVFDELLEKAFVEETIDGRIASIHERTVSEKISSYSLQQVLKSEHADESTFLQSYYAPTDELLLIAHQPTARGRCGQVVWDPTLGARPSYAGWHANAKRSDDKIDVHDNGFLTPRSTAARSARVVPPDLAKLKKALHYCSRRTIHWFDCGRWARPTAGFRCGRTGPCLVYERGTTARTRRGAPRGCRSNKQTVKASRRTSLVSLRTVRASRPSRRRVLYSEARTSLD